MSGRAGVPELIRRQRKTESSVRGRGVWVVVRRIRRITQASRKDERIRAGAIGSQHDASAGNQNRAAASSCIDSAKRIDDRDGGGSARSLGVVAADARGIDDASARGNFSGNASAK